MKKPPAPIFWVFANNLFRAAFHAVLIRVNETCAQSATLTADWQFWPASVAPDSRGIIGPVLELSDEQLVAVHREAQETQARRDQAVNELFRRYQSRVAAWCYRVSGDRDWAVDLAQEVFLRAFRNLASFRSESRFSTWLYTVTRNHCFNAIQAKGLRPEDPLAELGLPDTRALRADQQMELAEERAQIQSLIQANLDETERTVMALHYGEEEMTLAGITSLLGLQNASGAKAFVVSGRRKLEAAMARWRAGIRAAGPKETL